MARVDPNSYNVDLARGFTERLDGEGPVAATDWFYALSCDEGYVKDPGGASNLLWTHESRWGVLDISINRAKPEKDPAAIAAAAKERSRGGTACDLCIQEAPRPDKGGDRPKNLCIEVLALGGETWGFQYSPYAYFPEHSIALSAEHRPMHIDRAAFSCLLDFLDILPHYFIGSNADLPIVGGSILSHDHFQGGRHEFPMMRAAIERGFELPGYPEVEASTLVWPLSVIRLESASRERLLEAACHVLELWRGWDDEEAGIVSHTGDARHNTVTPICRKAGGRYVMDLALRCNITSDEHPLGVFHPHEDKWHVKKENIGLIEVMGLAILPPRLLAELETGALTQDEIGDVFSGVLEDAGVFKWDEAGRAAQQRFLDAL